MSFRHCLSLHWIILSCNFHKLESKELVILITFCEYAHRANRLKWPAIFSSWQSVEAVWLSWAHQNKQKHSALHRRHLSSSSLCIYTRFLFLFSSSALLYFWYLGNCCYNRPTCHSCQSALEHTQSTLLQGDWTEVCVCARGCVCICVLRVTVCIPQRCAEINRRWRMSLHPSGFLRLTVRCGIQGAKLTSGAHLTTNPNVPTFRLTDTVFLWGK